MAETWQEWLWRRFDEVDVSGVLRDLAQKKEDELISLLRPHKERPVLAGFSYEPQSQEGLRKRLDTALDLLTCGEVAAQLIGLRAAQVLKLRSDESTKDLAACLDQLTGSPAFQRYVEAYHFAGFRFLVGRRLSDTEEKVKEEASALRDKAKKLQAELAQGKKWSWRRRTRAETARKKVEARKLISAAAALTASSAKADHKPLVNSVSLPLDPPKSLNLHQMDGFNLLCRIAKMVESNEERTALDFLDGFQLTLPEEWCSELGGLPEADQERLMELWLRGLLPEWTPDHEGEQGNGDQRVSEFGKELGNVVEGLKSWARKRAELYWDLREGKEKQPDLKLAEAVKVQRPRWGWNCDTPLAARLALVDLYFLSKLLRAEVSPRGEVVYGPVSWLGLIGLRAGLKGAKASAEDVRLAKEMRLVEEVLRSVFGLTCELFHNGWELQAAKDCETSGTARKGWRENKGAKCWREVFDAELEAVSRQRMLRDYGDPGKGRKDESGSKEWSWALLGEGAPRELIGLCFSGGGIRSATFNLGVLEGLRDLDLLRSVDYLSTVSGGGFIGGWLVGNVRRSRYWLGGHSPWEDSIRHLRMYSSYLAPRTGWLSMDTWALGGIWLRNTLLIQLLVLVWVLAGFAGTYLLEKAYAWMEAGAASAGTITVQFVILLVVSVMSLAGLTVFIGASLWRLEGGFWRLFCRQIGGCAFAAWVGCALISARVLAETRLWISGCGRSVQFVGRVRGDCLCNTHFADYSSILVRGLESWPLVLVGTGMGLFVLTYVSLWKSDGELPEAIGAKRGILSRVGLAAYTTLLCTVVLHLLLSAVAYVALRPVDMFHLHSRGELYSFVFGPAAVVGSYSVVVLLLVGLIAKRSNERQREWWTRYGTWILLSAVLGMLLSGVVFGAPKLVKLIIAPTLWYKVKWTAIFSWVATMVGGVFAGKSSRTSDQTKERSVPLEVLAQAGGLLFFVTFLVASAWLLFAFFGAFGGVGSTSQTIVKTSKWLVSISFVVLLGLGWLFSARFEINLFGLNQLYRNRLVRSYLGATRWMPGMRHPDAFTQFDFSDDLPLTDLRQEAAKYTDEFRGPFPVLNCSMNMGGSRDLSLQTRHSASFIFTPLHCGVDRATIGYVDTKEYADGDIGLGMALAISGAAASPNMGFNTSPLVALLLSMFNVRLGWWIPNPGQKRWKWRALSSSMRYMVLDLLGIADDRSYCLNVSDGGHFENMGLYEMVRRRCKVIVLGDGECDEVMQFGGLANAIRLCATDFGTRIDIDLASLKLRADAKSLQHAAVGTIQYANGSIGRLIYLKSSLTGDEDATVAQYHAAHPTFPHETTANQFFREDQFESYRRLGKHVVRQAFRGRSPAEHLVTAAERMADTLSPQSCSIETFVKQSRELDELWERLRGLDVRSEDFLKELMGTTLPRKKDLTKDEVAVGLEIFQFMENVHMDLRLDDFWEHADNRGWAMLFMTWARSPRLRQVWRDNHRTFGIRFEYFCGRRLGLYRENPVLRVTPLPRD